MKKKNYIKIAIVSFTAMALFSSCLKDSRYVDFAGSPNVIEFPAVANLGQLQTIAVTAAATPTATNPILVNLASPTVSKSPITVKFKIDPAALAAYNAANTTAYIALPPADYTSNLSVTIPAGQREANLVVNINSALINIDSVNYVIPVTISDPGTGNIISGNYQTALVNVLIKNIYDGTYSINGNAVRLPAVAGDPLAGNFSGFTQSLPTAGKTTNGFAPIWATGGQAGGVAGTTLTIDPVTNKVTVASSGNATLANAPAYNNRYDPATKTYYISYVWSGGNRAETDTLTYVGP
jgi:Domain of unknown function (DUF1735)